jgi:RNA polymerase sigma-70 factor (ECF subfamily)
MSNTQDNLHRFDQFRAGSRDAFKYYYDLYVDRIHFYLRDLTRSRTVAEDLTQEAFIILFTRRQTINSEQHLKPFLYRTAKNLALDFLREHGRLEELAEYQAYIADQQSAESSFPRAEVVKGEVLVALKTAYLKLTPRRKQVLELYFFHDKTSLEIARLLGISRQTVLNTLSQSIIILRKGLDGRWEEISLFFS